MDDLAGGGNPWWGLRGQVKLELLHEELLIGIEFCIASENQCAAVGGREVHIQHLDGSELVEHGLGSEAACQRFEPGAQRDVQTIGHEGDEDVRLDPSMRW